MIILHSLIEKMTFLYYVYPKDLFAYVCNLILIRHYLDSSDADLFISGKEIIIIIKEIENNGFQMFSDSYNGGNKKLM